MDPARKGENLQRDEDNAITEAIERLKHGAPASEVTVQPSWRDEEEEQDDEDEELTNDIEKIKPSR